MPECQPRNSCFPFESALFQGAGRRYRFRVKARAGESQSELPLWTKCDSCGSSAAATRRTGGSAVAHRLDDLADVDLLEVDRGNAEIRVSPATAATMRVGVTQLEERGPRLSEPGPASSGLVWTAAQSTSS